jgi:hypothetical protein
VDIFVGEPCDGPCDIDATLDYDLNTATCIYDFHAILNYSGLPIHTVFWDFGDGTTGTGWNPSHHFACKGVYNVCVTLFAADPDGNCCFRKFCIRVDVDCTCCDDRTDDPTGGGGTSKDRPFPGNSPSGGMKPEDGINPDVKSLKLYPNPNDGGFNMVFNLPQPSTVKVSIMDMKGRKVYEKEMGELMPGEQILHTQANLPPGMYVCEIVAAGNSYRSNLVITK